MRLSLLPALFAAVLVPGCFFGANEPYPMGADGAGPVKEVRAFPDKVGGEAIADDPDLVFIPFVNDADKGTDTAYQDHNQRQPVPGFTAILCITTVGRYQARFRIMDADNRIAFQGRGDFGFSGELRNDYRLAPKGLSGCLEWPLNAADRLYPAASRRPGIYRWQVAFSFDDPEADFVAERVFSVIQWP